MYAILYMRGREKNLCTNGGTHLEGLSGGGQVQRTRSLTGFGLCVNGTPKIIPIAYESISTVVSYTHKHDIYQKYTSTNG